VYFDYCASCHGADATGTRFAPDLLARIARMQRAEFERVLESGYRGVENGPSPWAGIADVDRYATELWAYLEARVSNAVGPGELMPARPRDRDGR
jgi:mono/diheme cytochrome c family protein